MIMNSWYRMGYWFDRKNVLPDDGVCVCFIKSAQNRTAFFSADTVRG